MGERDLGKYHAERGSIKADLQLKEKDTLVAPWYSADFKFYTDPIWQHDEEGFSVEVHYSFNVLGRIFSRVKIAEKGIEAILSHPTDHNDCRSATDVIGCILSLEDQVEEEIERKRKE